MPNSVPPSSLHLVDATYELFRAHFGAPPKRAPDGTEVGATRGLLATMIVLVRDEGATHVGCATDHVIRSFRNALWPTYKTEEGLDPTLAAQFPLAEEILRAAGFVVWPMIEHEADDALATAASRWSEEVSQTLLCTVDKDLAQCVRGDRVVMADRRRKSVLDEAGVIAKFGVPPRSIPDFLALVGDSADGYPGVPGFGPKTAAALLSVFGALESIPADFSAWPAGVRGAKGLADKLVEWRSDAERMKLVATLRTDAPIAESLEDLRWRGARPELVEVTKRLGFPEVCERIPAWQ